MNTEASQKHKHHNMNMLIDEKVGLDLLYITDMPFYRNTFFTI